MKDNRMENWIEKWAGIREQAVAEVNAKGNLNNVELICRIHAYVFNHKFKTTKCGNTLIGWVVEIDNEYKSKLPKPKKRRRYKKK